MTRPVDVALVGCTGFPEGEDDTGGVCAALEARGLSAAWASWDDPDFVWADVGLAVLRATWDYTRRRPEFLAWADGVPRLANPAPVVRWNSDKTYLRELAERGAPVVPTSWAEPGRSVELPQGMAPEQDVVVKPTVGAGSLGAGRFGPGPDQLQRVREHAEALHAIGRTAMVQPYLAGVDIEGETALVFLAGEFSHAVRKGPMLPAGTVHPLPGSGTTHGLFVEENISAREPDADQLAVARLVLNAVPDIAVPDIAVPDIAVPDRAVPDRAAPVGAMSKDAGLLYARVDLLPGPDGPVLVELELIEPSLFLTWTPGGTERFADAVATRLAAP